MKRSREKNSMQQGRNTRSKHESGWDPFEMAGNTRVYSSAYPYLQEKIENKETGKERCTERRQKMLLKKDVPTVAWRKTKTGQSKDNPPLLLSSQLLFIDLGTHACQYCSKQD